jgi:hypothetical protein
MRTFLIFAVLLAAPAHADQRLDFWPAASGVWIAEADYYDGTGTPVTRGFGQLNRLSVEGGRVRFDDRALYPAGGSANATYSLGLARPGEGVEVHATSSGAIAADGSVTIDETDLQIGPQITTRIAPVDALRALQTGDKADGVRAYEAYWSLPAPGRRLRLLAGIDLVAKNGGPAPPGALRALAVYRDVAAADPDAALAALRARLNIKVVREAVTIDGVRHSVAVRLDAAISRCDLLASDPKDPARVVAFAASPPPLDAKAVAACRVAAKANPDEARFARQLARAKEAMGRR